MPTGGFLLVWQTEELMTLQKFDMQAVQDRVSESIKAQFAAFIPDDVWQGMVERETQKFIVDELPKLVRAELETATKALIKAELEKTEYAGMVLGPMGDRHPGTVIAQEVAKHLAPDLVQAMFAGIIQQAVFAVRNQMVNNGGRGW